MTGLSIDFRRPVAEILIIVVGILIAFGLDSWNDTRIERNLEAQYLDRLLEEVSVNVRTGELVITLASQKIGPLSAVDAIVRQPRETRSTEELVVALRSGALSLGWALPEFTDAVFEELRSTGNLGIIRDMELRAMLVATYVDIANAVERIDNRRSGFAQYVYGLLPPEYLYADDRRDPRGDPDLDELTASRLSTVIDSADFTELLNAERNYATFIIDLMEDMQPRIEKLEAALQQRKSRTND